ncbi:protein CHUP1, chloroplastic-like isoform X2 [Arachis stenosperma]|uniref:protein CHUP1, chloroplastic-like isoform X2 n=1 Tax=Arachis stenosperma TaxID=217475 RepID=UPI0025ABE545|nr:protein CHUP1, chloroplastic-like isoform X2 [Arachis stenosperma]
MMREEKGPKPFIVKLGLALALSFAGFIYSHLRAKRVKPSNNTSSTQGPPSGQGSHTNMGEGIGAALGSVSEGNYSHSEDTCINRVICNNSTIGISHSSKQNEDKNELFLPDRKSSEKDVEATACVSHEKDDYEKEVTKLKNIISMLQEREHSLEVQLLECCGLREQQKSVKELQNRLKISNMEAKMFSLKVQTLQLENHRLQEQVTDHAKVVAELEATKAKVELLQKKLKHEAEHNREQIIILQHRVSKLQEQEQECKAVDCDHDIQLKLQKLKDLESEVEVLRQSNFRLRLENSELAQRLDSTQILANAVLEEAEGDTRKEDIERLRQENERLMKEMEQLQADRCSDVEELVYLRWINACLRYELRNYQPQPGKTVAKDLSRSLSPTSEKKAKKLILEYANTNGEGNIVDFDLDQWFSSQGSSLTDSGEYDDSSSMDNSSTARTNTTGKTKIFSKLRRILHGKDSQVSSQANSGAQSRRSEFTTPTVTSRASFDLSVLSRMKQSDRRNSDSFVLGGSSKISPRGEASDLEKYAKALEDSSASARHQRRRRATSYS